MAFIEYIDVEKSFGPKKVLDHLNLTIEKGETMTILGGSGSGKTILLKILLGLVPVGRGKILVDGQDVLTMDEEGLLHLRRRVGMLFQGGALFDSLSVKENIAYALREHFHHSEEEIDRLVAEKLQLVGLSGIEAMVPSDLSGGMKKRVALARAISTNPEVILYDEPTTGLDPQNTTRINHLIREIQEKLRVTSIVVTHDIKSAFFVSDRLALLHRGKIEAVGSRQEMEKSENPMVSRFLRGELDNAVT